SNLKYCYDVADSYMKKKLYSKAIKYAKIACDNNQEKACVILGKAYIKKHDTRKGIEILDKTCTASNNAIGCYTLALKYAVGGDGIQENQKLSSKYFKKSCEKGLNATSCNFLAFNYEYSRGVKKNDGLSVYYYRKSLKLFDKDCKKNNFRSCNEAGDMYRDGKGVSQDLKEALEYYHIGCDKNDGPSCSNIGMIYEFATTYLPTYGGYLIKDIEKAKKYYLKACDNKYELGCEWFSKINR
ncbi:MAG: sel1 repeat family protein, partial [Bacteroidales bacterium]|nr:sel1 repeat family protein [Bacteroidales bacterium]